MGGTMLLFICLFVYLFSCLFVYLFIIIFDIYMYSLAQRHYLKANQPREFASMLFAWANQGYRSERDLYIARSVLM
jgi:hypothetical protein